MNKIFIFSIVGLLSFASYTYACSKHVTKDAGAELLKTVPNLKTDECAQDALMQIAIGSEYLKNELCYKMTAEESRKAISIIEKKEVMAALKEVYEEMKNKTAAIPGGA